MSDPSKWKIYPKSCAKKLAVHNTEGERLALVNNRRLAFVLARQHDLSPVTVH